MTSLMDLSTELRLPILRELLTCDGNLVGRPTIVLDADGNGVNQVQNIEEIRGHVLRLGQPKTNAELKVIQRSTNFRTSQLRISGPDKRGQQLNVENDQFASRCSTNLHPQILFVCRQLYLEGRSFLYEDKTIEVTFLYGYDEGYAVRPLHSSRSYCMGMPSISAALNKWPTLLNFRNWVYTIYLGPYHRRIWHTGGDRWAGRAADRNTLRRLSINELTITVHDSLSETDEARLARNVSAAIIPFYNVHAETPTIEGDVPEWVADTLRKYVTAKSRYDMLHTAILLQECKSKVFPSNTQGYPESHYPPSCYAAARELSYADSRMDRARARYEIDDYYKYLKDIIEPLETFLEHAVAKEKSRPLECDAVFAHWQEMRELEAVRVNIGWIRFWCEEPQ